MKIQQISIFMENRSGRLAKVAKVLGGLDINIRAMSLADTSDFGILRLVVSDTEKAKDALKDHGFTVRINDVVAVAIPDIPGTLGNLLSLMEQVGMNVEYMYSFAHRGMDRAIMVFRFDNLDAAVDVLLENDISILRKEDLLSY